MNSPIPHTDQELLQLMAKGDEAAFTALYHRYWACLYNTAFKSLKDPGQCKEVVHDVLLDMWNRRQELDIANPEAYLKTAVRLRVINFLKRNHVPLFFEAFDNFSSSPYLAENKLLENDILAVIEAWIKVLPEKRRQIFVRHFFRNLSTREIAGELNISQKTVQNQIGTALNLLRTRFGHLFFFLFYWIIFIPESLVLLLPEII